MVAAQPEALETGRPRIKSGDNDVWQTVETRPQELILLRGLDWDNLVMLKGLRW